VQKAGVCVALIAFECACVLFLESNLYLVFGPSIRWEGGQAMAKLDNLVG